MNVPQKRRERIFILSVDLSIKEIEVKKELQRALADASTDKFTRNLREKLYSAAFGEVTRSILKDISSNNDTEFRIV